MADNRFRFTWGHASFRKHPYSAYGSMFGQGITPKFHPEPRILNPGSWTLEALNLNFPQVLS